MSLWSQFPMQLKSDVHLRAVLTHVHSPLHLFLHPHRNTSEHEAAASGSSVKNGCQPCVALFRQPYVSEDGTNGERTSAFPHTCASWYICCFVCIKRRHSVTTRKGMEHLKCTCPSLPSYVSMSCAGMYLRRDPTYTYTSSFSRSMINQY